MAIIGFHPHRTGRVTDLIIVTVIRYGYWRGFNSYRPMTASYFGTIVYRSYKPKNSTPNWPAGYITV